MIPPGISLPDVATVSRHSLCRIQLCGVDRLGNGTFTLAAVEKLCEVLPNTNISTLKCAACHTPLKQPVYQRHSPRAVSLLTSVCVLFHSLASNHMVSETGYVNKMRAVQGESFDVGAKVMYSGRQMTVCRADERAGEIKMVDTSAMFALCDALPRMTALTELECASHSPVPSPC